MEECRENVEHSERTSKEGEERRMTDDLMPIGHGWHRPPGSRKFHYFENTRSLCGRYAFMKIEGDKPTDCYNKSDCAKCVAELKKRKEKEQ